MKSVLLLSGEALHALGMGTWRIAPRGPALWLHQEVWVVPGGRANNQSRWP